MSRLLNRRCDLKKLFIAVFTAILLVMGAWFGVSFFATGVLSRVTAAMTPAPECPSVPPVTVGNIVVPAGPVAGFCQPELVMAAHIMTAARDQGIGTHTQAVGVMTAIGESGLQNLSHGDTAGPDSRGLFQQRDNGAWGTLADRMNPHTAATNFFDKLTSIQGWRTMAPTELAHLVQGNSDASYYSQYWAKAQTIVAALQP